MCTNEDGWLVFDGDGNFHAEARADATCCNEMPANDIRTQLERLILAELDAGLDDSATTVSEHCYLRLENQPHFGSYMIVHGAEGPYLVHVQYRTDGSNQVEPDGNNVTLLGRQVYHAQALPLDGQWLMSLRRVL